MLFFINRFRNEQFEQFKHRNIQQSFAQPARERSMGLMNHINQMLISRKVSLSYVLDRCYRCQVKGIKKLYSYKPNLIVWKTSIVLGKTIHTSPLLYIYIDVETGRLPEENHT